MTLFEKIMQIYPTLELSYFDDMTIMLQNDSDGKGDYIKFWNHPSLARPTDEELA
jgi:hypothetical protein